MRPHPKKDTQEGWRDGALVKSPALPWDYTERRVWGYSSVIEGFCFNPSTTKNKHGNNKTEEPTQAKESFPV